MNDPVVLDKNDISIRVLWAIRCLFLMVFYAVMYISKNSFGLTYSYKIFLFLPILFLIMVKNIFQRNKIMVSGSKSLKISMEICWASAMSVVIFFLIHVYNK